MTNFISFKDDDFKKYFYSSKNPQKFILYCAVINRIIYYINKNGFANFESFIINNNNKDLFLINSESEYIIKNFENEICKFTNQDYISILSYLKYELKFEENESSISKEISKQFQLIAA